MNGIWIVGLVVLFVITFFSIQPTNPCATDVCEDSNKAHCRRHCKDVQLYNWRTWIRSGLIRLWYLPLMLPVKYVGRHRIKRSYEVAYVGECDDAGVEFQRAG